MAEIRLLTFMAVLLLILYVEWHAIVSPRLLRMYFRRYSIRMLLVLTLVSAAFFTVVSHSATPTSDAAVFLFVLIVGVLGVCLVGFAYCDYFGPRIDRRMESELPRSHQSVPRPKVRTKGQEHRARESFDEVPYIEVVDERDTVA
ncbi:MAG: hypothetical protein AAFX06_00405 [Planctomycetota bacterium]